MEKTMRFAEIPQIRRGVVFSDPFYGPDVWCQYRKEFNPSSSWAMKMESSRDEDGYAYFILLMGRGSVLSGLRVVDYEEGAAIHHYAHHVLESKEIGADTARVFIGSLDCFEKFGDEASIYTAADGLFGELQVITCKGEQDPAGFLFMGEIDTAVTDEDQLFRTITAAFDGHEIDLERFEKLTDPNSLEVRKQLSKEVQRAKALDHDDKRQPKKGRNDQER